MNVDLGLSKMTDFESYRGVEILDGVRLIQDHPMPRGSHERARPNIALAALAGQDSVPIVPRQRHANSNNKHVTKVIKRAIWIFFHQKSSQ